MIRTASRRPAVAGPVLRATLFVTLLAAMLVAFTWSRTRTLAAAYQLGQLQKAHARLTAEHDRLVLEVEALKAPAALERFARTRLSMAPPPPGAVIAVQAAAPSGAPAASPSTASRPAVEPNGGRAAAGARTASANAGRDAEVPGVQRIALRGPSRVPASPQ
jgi:cell division protein FtsL